MVHEDIRFARVAKLGGFDERRSAAIVVLQRQQNTVSEQDIGFFWSSAGGV